MRKVFHWFAVFPLGVLHFLGACVGWIAYLASPTYRRRMAANAAQAGMAAGQWRGAISSAGRMVMELPFVWARPAGEPILPHVRLENETLLQAALDKGRGVLLLTPHMGCFEIAAQAIAERFGAQATLTVLYRPARKAWLRELVDTSRSRPHMKAVPATLAGVRQMIRALRNGEMVGLLPDQVPPDGMGVWAPFFGKPAYTMTLAARLVQQTGAEPVLTWVERLPRGRGFVQRFEAFPEAMPDNAEAAAQAVNRAMEKLIRQCPQQYLWGYHRYKGPSTRLALEGREEGNA